MKKCPIFAWLVSKLFTRDAHKEDEVVFSSSFAINFESSYESVKTAGVNITNIENAFDLIVCYQIPEKVLEAMRIIKSTAKYKRKQRK